MKIPFCGNFSPLCLLRTSNVLFKIDSITVDLREFLLLNFALAISKCYGKVRVLFFPRDTSVVSCTTQRFCVQTGAYPLIFLTKIPKQKCSLCTFIGTNETFFPRCCETFFEKFLLFPKGPFSRFWSFATECMLKKSQRIPTFRLKSRVFSTQNSPAVLLTLNIKLRKSVHREKASL